jgi:hypothetical protein
MRDVLATAGAALAAALAEAVPGGTVSVRDDGDGVVVTVAARGLGGREFGRPGRPPRPVVAAAAASFAPRFVMMVAEHVREAGDGRTL